MKIRLTVFFIIFILCVTLNDSKKVMNRSRRNYAIKFLFTSAPVILQDIYDLWHVLLSESSMSVTDAIFRSKEHVVLGRIAKINRDILRLQNEIRTAYASSMQTIFTMLPNVIKRELKLDEVEKILHQIDIAQIEFHDYISTIKFNITLDEVHSVNKTNSDLRKTLNIQNDMNNEIPTVGSNPGNSSKGLAVSVERTTVLNFVDWATSQGSDSIKNLAERLHRLFIPVSNFRSSLVELLIDPTKEVGTMICNMKESPHQMLYNLYNSVVLADYKSYVMLQFSYMILKIYGKGNFLAESNRERSKFEKRSEEKANAVRNALAIADRSVYNCDPKQYVEGVNYVRLTKLLQGYVENEVNLNPYGTCRENCAFYLYTEFHGCYKDQFCSKQPSCRGKVVECRYIDSDMNICKSNDPERRYDWIEYESGAVYGNKGKCLARNLFKVDSWWRYLFWHCSYCFCLCDDGNYNSDRYFNLREVLSEVAENKVITGVRIVKRKRIIHFQIRQGTLKPGGLIDKSTLSWKPVHNYTVTDRDVQNGIDYHTMSWLDRIIDIDEVSGSGQQVLTGIRFRKIGHHLNLEIRVTPINFTTGEVHPEVHSIWLSNDNTEISMLKPRKEIILTNPDIPIRYKQHELDSEHDQFIKFQASSFDHDAGQNTIPYFDSQPVISYGFPVSGMGLIHRGKTGSGGFIAPKLVSYDFSQHV